MSNARKARSCVAPMKTSPLLVASEPPNIGMPIRSGSRDAMPTGPLSRAEPIDRVQTNLRVRRSIAEIVPNGGSLHGTLSGDRSEENTSELQSLMRNSYDAICLKHNKTTQRNE